MRRGDQESDPVTREDFEAAIEVLVRTAVAIGVCVKGGFGIRHPSPDEPDWAIEITRLQKRRMSRPTENRPGTNHEEVLTLSVDGTSDDDCGQQMGDFTPLTLSARAIRRVIGDERTRQQVEPARPV